MEVAAAFDIVALRHQRAIGAFAGRQVSLASDNRLDSVLNRFFVELDGSEHVAMIGNRHRFHTRFFGMRQQRPNLIGTIEQAVLSMNVQMNETHDLNNASSTHPLH